MRRYKRHRDAARTVFRIGSKAQTRIINLIPSRHPATPIALRAQIGASVNAGQFMDYGFSRMRRVSTDFDRC